MTTPSQITFHDVALDQIATHSGKVAVFVTEDGKMDGGARKVNTLTRKALARLVEGEGFAKAATGSVTSVAYPVGMAAEAALLDRAIPSGSLISVMDERGKVQTSPDFANQLAGWRDQGRQDVAFVIGGADGIDPALRARADATLSFGKMVWPHMLVRVMLAEQLYRAASILSNGPYHRV